MTIEVQGIKDKIVARIIQEDKKTAGGIIVPETAKKEPQLTCLVTSIGKEVTKEIEVGDRLYCHASAGMDIISGDVIMKVLKDDEVYAVIREKEDSE